MHIAFKWIADHGLTVWAVLGPLATTQKEDADEERADHNLIGIIQTRLFINDFVTRENLIERWNKAFHRYSQSYDLEELRTTLKMMIDCVLKEAKRLKT